MANATKTAPRLKIRRGDLVQILAGKDRGKQGRVLDARPAERRVIVENLNVVKRHSRPKPMKDPSRMGAPQVIPGGIIEKASAVAVSNVMVVCPVCSRPTRVGMTAREAKGGTIHVRVCKRADCGQDIDR